MALVLLLEGLAAQAAPKQGDAMDIMKKVAANTAAAIDGRRQYVYHQRIRAGLLKSNGEVVCRESREYTVVPQPAKTEKKLVSFSGECRDGKQMAAYDTPASPRPGVKENAAIQVDDERESITGMIGALANDRNSKDGIPPQLFPLSAEELPYYRFTLKGETTLKGRRTYDITFVPVEHKGFCVDIDGDKDGDKPDEGQAHVCRPWKGEVWIDAEDYQPSRIDTQMAKGVPWGVRVFMGINVRQLGFSLNYQRVADGVWFPATYGTEFRLTVFWGYKRTVTLSMENTDFRKTDAQSIVEFDQATQ
jgi:hypothetical protein